ncbi:MAG: redoxin domain-containing protein [Halanaerobiaceae bacterium]
MVISAGNNPNAIVLPDQEGNDIYISDYDQKFKLLSFHPLAWTSTCASQMKDLDQHYQEFIDNNTIPFGISMEPVPTKKAWAEELGLKNLKILSDFYPLGFAARMMGVFIESRGHSKRANILMDPRGKVVWSKEYHPSERPDIKEVLEEVKNAGS